MHYRNNVRPVHIRHGQDTDTHALQAIPINQLLEKHMNTCTNLTRFNNYFSEKTHLIILAFIFVLAVFTLIIHVHDGKSDPQTAESFALITLGLIYGMLALYVMLAKAKKELKSIKEGVADGEIN